MALLRWIVAIPLGIAAGVGLGIVGTMAATGSTDGGRLGLLLLGLGVGLFPAVFASAKRIGGVFRRSSVVLLLEAIAIPALGFLYPALAGGRAVLGPELLQWTRQPEAFASWASAGYGLVAVAVICALVGALGLVLLLAGSQQAAPTPTRSTKEPAPKPSAAAAPPVIPAQRPAAIASPATATTQREVPARPSTDVAKAATAAPSRQASDDDAGLTADLASLREKLARINSQQPPSGQS